jgi:uncharacterized protein (DUF2267 family)
MSFRELIKRVQLNSGFSDSESKEALELMVESLAERLTAGERKDFASQLPQELQTIALTAPNDIAEYYDKDILKEFMEREGIEEARAKKQIMSAWNALKEAISEGEINDIRSQLPNSMVALLH